MRPVFNRFVLIALFLSGLLLPSLCVAATSGPSPAGTAAGTNWTSTGNTAASDNADAGYNNTAQDDLKLTNFGFAIPVNNIIDGIEVEREASGAGNSPGTRQYRMGLTKDGTALSGTRKTGQALPKTTDDVVTVGTTSDLWGTTWTAAEINAASFGVLISDNDTSANGLNFDRIRVTVTHHAPVTTIGDGTSPANKTVLPSSTKQAVDAFTLSSESGTDTLTALTFTFSGTTSGDVAASGVKIYKDVNADTEWDAEDTLITNGTASFSGNTASFSSLSEGITTTPTNYIITYDIVASPGVGNTLLGAVTAATVTTNDPPTISDTNDATLTIASTCSVVRTTDDTAIGSLRGCITWANGNAGTDTVILPANTYTLTLTGAAEDANASGDLDITESLDIVGDGMATTLINGNATTLGERILHTTAGNVTLTDLSLQNDNTAVSDTGGGIRNDGTSLTMTRVSVTGNRTSAHGGGIYTNATMTLTDVEVDNNHSTAGDGGAIYILNGTNTWTGVTLSNNSASGSGGAIRNGATLNVFNTTISNNSASSGSAFFHNASATFTNTTFYGNTGSTAIAVGGGASTTLENTIISNPGVANCQQALTSSGGNLETDTDTCGFVTGTDQNTVSVANLNINATLADNGGYTKTHALNSGSYAIDAAVNANCPATDQRATSRGYDGDASPNSPQSGDCDIGAYESTSPATGVGDGTAPSNKTVLPSATNQAVDVFTLSTNTGSDTLTALTVTFTGTNVSDVAASGVKIYKDNNADSEWDAGDTLITNGTASFSGVTASFSSLSESISTTPTNYIVTYDIVASPGAENTLLAAVTAATVTTNNPPGITDSTDATLTIASTCSVTTTTDNIAGSLRNCITWANGNPGTDTIIVPAGAYNLTVPGTGENLNVDGDLDITQSLNIVGAGMTSTFIDAAGIAGERAIHITAGDVVFTDLAIRNASSGSNTGAGILNNGTSVTLTRVALTGNTSSSSHGGGIYSNATLTLNDVELDNNQSPGGNGGGIYNIGGTVTWTGGTASNNYASGSGGAIRNGGSTLDVTNVTFSGNSADSSGAAIVNSSTATLTNVTIVGSTGLGSDAYRQDAGSTTMKNTIISNTAVTNCNNNNITSVGGNLETDTNTCMLSDPTDQNTVSIGNLNINATLSNNGGYTKTHALSSGSYAIDAAVSANCPATDQRGTARGFDGDATPNSPQSGDCDIGAYEYTAAAATTTIADGTAPANQTTSVSSTNKAVSAFTLATDSGSDTLTAITVTRSGTSSDSDVASNGVKIWRDDGSTANQWDALDTQIGSGASLSSSTAAFSSLSESINSTPTQYIVTYDIASGATGSKTLLGAITAATVTNTLVNTDTTDATLTVGSLTCDVDPNGTYMEAEDFSGTAAGNGTYAFTGILSAQAGYLGTGYLETSNNNFNDYTDVNNNPGNYDRYDYQVNFPTTGTYQVWLRGYETGSDADDSIYIGLDGTATGAIKEVVQGGWEWTSTVQNGVTTITVGSAGVHTINVWPRELTHKLDGIYITTGASVPTDGVHGLDIDPSSCVSYTISGKVFEDAKFAGAAADYVNETDDKALANVDVELYNSSDVYQGSTITDVNGDYSFSVLADDTYKVRVRAATIADADTTPKGGLNGTVPGTWPYPMPEMTWANGSAMYGGQSATADDTDTGDNAGPGDNWVSVAVSGANVTSVNMGFAYNLITNVADDGNADNALSDQGSFRQFIKNANAIGAAGGTTANSSEFRMQVATNQTDGSGNNWWRTTLSTLCLPQLTDGGTTIDGSRQRINSGSNDNALGPEIEIDGDKGSIASCTGLYINNVATMTIQEIVLGNFSTQGITMTGAGANGINLYGNYIGTDAVGGAQRANDGFGVWLTTNTSNVNIGGTGAGQGNIISGNGNSATEGEITQSSGTTINIIGNIIGLDRTGTVKLGNAGPGITISGGDGVIIGGSTVAARNLIAGNDGAGISLKDWTRNVTVQGNHIGTGITGTETTLGNGADNINLASFYDPSIFIIGGLATGEGNVIARSSIYGIRTQDSGTGDFIQGNTIYSNTTGGIYSATDSVTIEKNQIYSNGGTNANIQLINDVGTGQSNNLVYNNTIHDSSNGSGIKITGLNAIIKNNIITGNATYGINVSGGSMTDAYNLITDNTTADVALRNPSGQSNVALDATTLNTDPLFTNEPADDYTLQNTSPAINRGCDLGAAGDDTGCDTAADGAQPDLTEGANPKFYPYAPDLGAFENTLATTCVVSTTADNATPPYGSLRECINTANANPGTTIKFALGTADSGYQTAGADNWWRILLASELPAITANGTIIDGTSQTTLADSNSLGPEIELRGAASMDGFELRSDNNEIRGFIINGFATFGFGGIKLDDTVAGAPGPNGNTVAGNYIGSDYTGTAAPNPNATGVYMLNGANNNTVGGTTAADRNIIVGQTDHGVWLRYAGTSNNDVIGNYIGIEPDGATPLGNNHGVYISAAASSNAIGGLTADRRNIISGNSGNGVYLSGDDTDSNTIAGNYIGTNAAGTAAVPNTLRGVYLNNGPEWNTIGSSTGGTTGAGRNVISGNTSHGVWIRSDNGDNNTVIGNFIGTKANGTEKLGNGGIGVAISTSSDFNQIGGTTDGERNIIAGNSTNGVYLSSTGTTGNKVYGNYIGTNFSLATDLGNTSNGVIIQVDASNNEIGGTAAGQANTIAYNGADGVDVTGINVDGNKISGNSIFENTGLGINLAGDGANNDKAAPTISSVTLNGADFDVTLTTTASDVVEFFRVNNTAAPAVSGDGSGAGEGYLFLGSCTDGGGACSGPYISGTDGAADGSMTVTLTSGGLSANDVITATATDGTNGTSEFSANAVAPGSGPYNVYYSVGQNTTDHMTGSPTVTISGSTATFSVAQTATNMGVGDKVTYNTSQVAYISGKISTTQWTLITATGGPVADITNATVDSIAHAYASLFAAEAGASDANHLNTANLVTGNYVLNIPTYYDTGADTTAVAVDGWTTGTNNYIKIYSPNNTSTEVNQSQRHAGVWNTGKYHMQLGNNTGIHVNVSNGNRHVRIEGLQIYITSTNAQDQASIYFWTNGGGSGSVDLHAGHNIFRGTTSAFNYHSGVNNDTTVALTGATKIYNNIMYGFKGSSGFGAWMGGGMTYYVYNNTIYDSNIGLFIDASSSVVAKNNLISASATQAASGTFSAGTDYNATNDASMGYTVTGGGNTNDRLSQTFTFVSAGTDFHLAGNDSGAKNVGVDLSADPNLAFSTDIDGQTRPYFSTWDIGADESSIAASPITISGTCKQVDEATNCADGVTIRVAVNASLEAQTTTTSAGAWAISGVNKPNSGDVVTVYIEGVADANEAVAVTKYDGTGNITGVQLMEEHLTLGSDDNQTLTNGDLGQYDNSVSANEDIFHDVNAGALTVDATALLTNEELYILTGNGYTPGGTVATKHVQIEGTWTATGSETYSVEGDWEHTNGTFNYATSTVDFTGTGTIKIDIASYWTKKFYNVNGAAAGQTTTLFAGRGIDVSNVLTLGTGTITGSQLILSKETGTPLVTAGATISTQFTKYTTTTGPVNVTGTTYSKLLINADVASSTFNLAGNVTCTDLKIYGNNAGITSTLDTTGSNHGITCNTLHVGNATNTKYGALKLNNSAVDINGDVTIYASDGGGTNSIDADSSTINVSGNWANSDLLTANTSTVVLDGVNQTLTGSTTFNNLSKTESSDDGTDAVLTFDNTAAQTINGLLTLDGLDADDRINLVSDSVGTPWSIAIAGTKSIDNVDVQDSDASTSAPGNKPVSPTTSVSSGNNIDWFADSVSGTVYTDDDEVTPMVGETVRLYVNGVDRSAVVPDGSGNYTIDTNLTAADAMVVYLDSGGGNQGSTVTVSDGANLAALNIYQNHVVTRHDNAGVLTNTLMNTAGDSTNDADIMYTVTNGPNFDLTVVGASSELYVPTGHSYTPGGLVSTKHVQIEGTWTATTTETYTVSGDWEHSNGTFNYATSTIDMTGTGTIKVDSATWWTKPIYNLNAAAAGQTTTIFIGRGINTRNVVTLGTGTLAGGDLDLNMQIAGTPLVTAGATLSNNIVIYKPQTGTLNVAAAAYPTLHIRGNAATSTSQLAGNITCNDLVIVASSNTKTAILDTSTSSYSINCNSIQSGGGVTTRYGQMILNGSTVTTGDFSITTSDGGGINSVTANTSTINVSGNWTNSDTFTAGTSTVNFDGAALQSVTACSACTLGTFSTLQSSNASAAGVSFLDAFTTTNFTDSTAASKLTFKAGSTYTVSGTLTVDGTSGNEIVLLSDTPATRFTLDVTGGAQTVAYVNVTDSQTSTNDITAYNATNVSGNDDGEATPHWVFPVPINVSGTCKLQDEATNCADASTVRVAVNGTLQGQSTTTSAGAWTIAGASISSGDVVTVYIEGVADANEAVAVTKYDGTGNITGIDLFEEHLTLGSDDNQTLTNADLGQYDYSASSNNEDIFIEVDAANDLAVDNLANMTNEELYIKTGNTYRPDSASSGNVSAQHIEILGILTADGNTLTVRGDWDSSLGTFNHDTSSVVLTGASNTLTTQSSGNAWDQRFYNLTLNAGADITVQTAATASGFRVVNLLTLSGKLTVPSGKTVSVAKTGNLVVNGSGELAGAGIFTRPTDDASSHITNSGTISIADFRFSVQGGATAAPVTATTYGGILRVRNNGAGSGVGALGAGTLTVTGNLIIEHATAGDTLTLDNTVNNTSVTAGGLAIGWNGDNTKYGKLMAGSASYDINGDVTLYASDGSGDNTLDADTSTINVSGNWNNNEVTDTVLEDTSTVILDGTAQSVSGATTFYSFNKTVAAADTLTFAAGSTTTIAALGTLTLDGDPGQLLSLVSATPGTRWNLTLSATAIKAIDYVDVKDSDASGSAVALKPINPTNSVDSGNNFDWFVYITPDATFTEWCDAVGTDFCIDDEGGADDWTNPAKLDITEFGVASNRADTFFVLFGFDDTTLANASTACVLIDTDNDTVNGYIDFALCAVLDGGPTSVTSVELYACDDTVSGGCGAASLSQTYVSYGFSNAASGPWDTDSYLDVPLPYAHLGITSGAGTVLLNTLISYPGKTFLKSPKDSIYEDASGNQDYGMRTAYDVDAGVGVLSASPGHESVSGIVYSDEGVTGIGNNRTVRLLVNGVSRGTDITDSAGGYFISVPAANIADGDNILVYVDEDDGTTDDGTTVTVNKGPDLGDIHIYKDHLITRHDNTGALTNALMKTAVEPYSDTEILYAVDGSNVLTVGGASTELYVPTGHTYVPGGNVNTTHVEIEGIWTATTTETYNVSGNWTNNGAFTYATSRVVLTGTAQTLAGSTTFYNLTKAVTSADTLTFQAGQTQTLAAGGALSFTGTSGYLLQLRSSTPGTEWFLTVNAGVAPIANYVDVKDSMQLVKQVWDASGGTCLASVPSDAACSGGATAVAVPAGNPVYFFIYVRNPMAVSAPDTRFQDLLDDTAFTYQTGTLQRTLNDGTAGQPSDVASAAAIFAAATTAQTDALDGDTQIDEFAGIDTTASPDNLTVGGSGAAGQNDTLSLPAHKSFGLRFRAVQN